MTTTRKDMGHWVVNGQDFCQTAYEHKLIDPQTGEEVYLFCHCTKEQYEPMARALKAAHGDGTSEQVHWTKWYPTPCTKGNRDTEFVTRRYICLALFTKALDATMQSSVSYELVHEPDECPYCGEGLDEEQANKATHIKIRYERYAMDGNGYHVGYEIFEGTAELTRKHGQERNEKKFLVDPLSAWLVDLDTFDTEIIETPEEEECACASGECGCDEEHCCSEDECMCEGYYPADEDFANQEMMHIFESAQEHPIKWTWEKQADDAYAWVIRNYLTGETVD